ncbi:hypothetical protein NDU88_002743 [Pleurodeles waltl]|uniref:Uncharacterized protein n=1 Tax=Pleurodeles waltl TaxID=8319 RepID=A0AAV7PA85_PLEWA|nr:hypothetical protein NDU88_002743 [Pleurodeles waltl]
MRGYDIVCYKMDQVVHQLREGQRKLEWTLEKHTKQAEVDLTVLATAIPSRGDNLTKMAEGQSQLVSGIDHCNRSHCTVLDVCTWEDFLNFEWAARASAWPTER